LHFLASPWNLRGALLWYLWKYYFDGSKASTMRQNCVSGDTGLRTATVPLLL
jgi:hypothetical protein